MRLCHMSISRATYLGLHFPLHHKSFWHIKTLLYRRPIVNLNEPPLYQSELFDIDPSQSAQLIQLKQARSAMVIWSPTIHDP